MRVDLLQEVSLAREATLVFANGDALTLGPGRYWTAAFGVVVDLDGHRCLASTQSSWKLTAGRFPASGRIGLDPARPS